MLRKTIPVIFLFFYLPAAFGQSPTIITGSFDTAPEGAVVYLYDDHGDKDSATIQKGKFKFELDKLATDWHMYFIKCPILSKSYGFPLFLKRSSNLNFQVNKELTMITISGDKAAVEQHNFYRGFYDLSVKMKKIKTAIEKLKDPMEITRLNTVLKKLESKNNSFAVNWVYQHLSSPFSAAVLRVFVDQSPSLKRLDTIAATAFDALSALAIANNHDAVLLQKTFSKYDTKYALVAIGDNAPSFTIRDTADQKIGLDDFKGKWVLLDFWASWCGPCRQNNPALKSLFVEYKEKGLNILSISLDRDSGKWKKAILQDDMTWYHGTDLLEYGGVASSYQIIGVPTYFLISPEGKLVAKSVGGDINIMKTELVKIFKQ